MRNTMKLLTALAAVLVFLPSTRATAQRRRGLVDVSPASERHGFWLNLGVAAGGENYRYTHVPGGWQRPDGDLVKPSVAISLGGTVSPQLRLGGELNAWAWDHNDADTGFHVTDYLVGGLLVGQVYPVRRLGLFVKGGLGISRSGEAVEGGRGIGETGFAYLYGAGYEIRVSRSLFLTPTVAVMQHVSNNPDDPLNQGSLHERVWTIGVALTIQPGR